MRDIQVVLVNEQNGKQGEFVLPLNNEEIMQKLSSNEDDVFLVEFELKCIAMSMATIEDLNNLYYKMQELSKEVLDNIEPLVDEYFQDFNDVYENKDNLIFYEGIGSSLELAVMFVEDGDLGEVPEKLKYYIDYESLGNDIEVESTLIKVNDGLFVID